MNNDQHQARMQGEQDAELDVTKILWIVVGFFITLIGLIIAYIYQPSPPATRLVDKSNEYIMFYTEAYKNKCRSIQLTYTAIGFAVSAGIGILIFIAGMAMIGSISNSFPY